jgi:hypothetical protein
MTSTPQPVRPVISCRHPQQARMVERPRVIYVMCDRCLRAFITTRLKAIGQVQWQ